MNLHEDGYEAAEKTNFQPSWMIEHKYRFLLFHLIALFGTLYTGITTQAFICFVFLYLVRMFGVTAGYHRYFSHRSFKTSRFFAFLLALLAQSSTQKGVIWWARNHRHHHRFSDKEEDIHSPIHHGFWNSHLGWIFAQRTYVAHRNVADLERVPELRFLNKYPMIPVVILGAFVFFTLDLSSFFFGFFMSTVFLLHGTFTINSLSHIWGSQRYHTSDDSRNNFFLALVTLGEGWHNNHHRYMRSVRQGFYWWEIDITFYVLKVVSWTGLIWDLRAVPKNILEEGQR